MSDESGTRHSVVLRRNHDRNRAVVSGDRLIGGLAVVGAVGRDLLDQRFDVFKQRAHPGFVTDGLIRQCDGHDLPAAGIHAEVQLAPPAP